MSFVMNKSYQNKVNSQVLNEPVAVYLHAASDYLQPEIISFARQGVSAGYAFKLAEQLSLSLHELADILHISVRTVQRWQTDKVLDTDQSSKIIQLAGLLKQGSEVFGDGESFGVWLHEGVPVLQGLTPLSYLDTPFGFDLINQVLGRIEHGVFA